MSAFVQIVKFLIDVAGEIGARINKALDTEQQALSCFEVNAHGPKGDFELHDLSWGYLLFLVMWVERNHGSAPFRDLGTM